MKVSAYHLSMRENDMKRATTAVVINQGYGGFGISVEAGHALQARGVKIDFFNGYRGESCAYLPHDFPRHDPRLVQVVRQLGPAASGELATLGIVEITGTRYRITEYDGAESIETPDSIDWITVEGA